MVRIFGNGVGWTASAPKLSSVGLWLNASKSESMLAATIFTLTGVFVPIAFWSTRYFTTLPNVGRVKSSVDDLNGTGYCKHESSLVLRSAEVQPLFLDLYDAPSFGRSKGCVVNPPPPHYITPQCTVRKRDVQHCRAAICDFGVRVRLLNDARNPNLCITFCAKYEARNDTKEDDTKSIDLVFQFALDTFTSGFLSTRHNKTTKSTTNLHDS